MSPLQIIAMVELVGCWILWSLAFIKPRKQAVGQQAVVTAPASKWGILLQSFGFFLAWLYVGPMGFQKPTASIIASMILGPVSVALAWSATRHLGKHWRYQAALSADHELVQTGAYRLVRHPIYASMLGMLLAVGFVWTWWPRFIAAIIFFVAGTEVRVRAEDRLLEERFQDAFVAYRTRVRAYIPGLR